MKSPKAVFLFVPLFFLLAGFCSAFPADSVDVVSYRIDAAINSDGITETVILKAVSKKPVKKMEMELNSSMELTSCRLDEKDVPFERSGWNLELDLGEAGSPRGEFTLVFEAKGKPYNNQRNKFIRTNVCADHAYIRTQYAWYPRCHDDLALYETKLKVRKDWLVRTAGDLKEKTEVEDGMVWRFVLKKPCRNIGLAAGGYTRIEHTGEGGIALDALVFPGHEEGGEALLAVAEKAIKFYSGLFGPMSGTRFTLVEMPAPFGTGSGYGMTGYSLIGTGAFEGGGAAPWAESLVAHEVSHTWWGREVGFSNFANEMLATYSPNRYLERFSGKEESIRERLGFRKRVASTVAGQGSVSLDEIQGWGGSLSPAVYSAHAYSKAAMVLHILECEMGRKGLDAALKDLFSKYRGQVVDYRIVSRELGGSRYKWVFQQWGQAEIPSLREEHNLKKSGSGFNVKGSLFQEGTPKPFKMEVTLRAVAREKLCDFKVKVKKGKTPFKFTCPFEPEKIVIDPEGHLLFGSGGLADAKALRARVFNVVNSPNAGDEKTLLKTIKDLDRLIDAKEGKTSECIAGKGRCLFRLGKLDEAKEELERAVNMRDSGPFWRSWIYLRLGCIADMKKKRADAIDFYEKAVAVSNGSQPAIGRARGYLKKAYRSYKKDG